MQLVFVAPNTSVSQTAVAPEKDTLLLMFKLRLLESTTCARDGLNNRA